MNFRPALLAVCLGLRAAAGDLPPPPTVAEPFAETLIAVDASAPAQARAIWLDARHVRWAVPAGTARVLLLGAADGGLQVTVGSPVSGAQSALTLEPSAQPALPDAARFSSVSGTTWRVAEADANSLPGLWRGQLLIVAEDPSGRVLASTGTQLAGALDAWYGPAATLLEFGARPGSHLKISIGSWSRAYAEECAATTFASSRPNHEGESPGGISMM